MLRDFCLDHPISPLHNDFRIAYLHHQIKGDNGHDTHRQPPPTEPHLPPPLVAHEPLATPVGMACRLISTVDARGDGKCGIWIIQVRGDGNGRTWPRGQRIPDTQRKITNKLGHEFYVSDYEKLPDDETLRWLGRALKARTYKTRASFEQYFVAA